VLEIQLVATRLWRARVLELEMETEKIPTIVFRVELRSGVEPLISTEYAINVLGPQGIREKW